jgi:hypothetical protein
VTVVESPAGQTQESVPFPASDLDRIGQLEDLWVSFLRSPAGPRRRSSEQSQAIQDFGQRLFEAFLVGKANSLYHTSRQQAHEEEKLLRLKLRIRSPELAVLPWELLYDTQAGEYLCLSRNTAVVRYVPSSQAGPSEFVAPPLRVLGMVASPRDLPPLDADEEKQRLQNATQHLQERELLQLDWVDGQTWRDLRRELWSEEWHIFYLVGHGGNEPDAAEGFAVLASDDGSSHRISAARLSRVLSSRGPLKLVWLTSGQRFAHGEQHRFSSTAPLLVERGLPGVLAMQQATTEQAAAAFACAFLEALSTAAPLDVALTRGRVAINSKAPSTAEWSVPVLYTHSPALRLYDEETLASATCHRADAALARDDLQRAMDQYTLASEMGAGPIPQEKRALAAEAHLALGAAQEILSSLTGNAETQADAILEVMERLEELEERLPRSRAIQSHLNELRKKGSSLRDRLWKDGRRLMRRRSIGLTLERRHRRIQGSVRLLQKAASLDPEALPALNKDLTKALYRLEYLQKAQSRAKPRQAQRLGVYGLVGLVVVAALIAVCFAAGLVPLPTLTARATPTTTPSPSPSASPALTPTIIPSPEPSHTLPPPQANTVTPTPEPSSTATPAYTATSTPSPSPPSPTSSATATQTWTATPTPQPTASPTARPRRATPTRPPSPSPTARLAPRPIYSAPVLLEPENVVFLSLHTDSTYILRWAWDGSLQADEWFDVRVWQEGMPHHGIAWTKQNQYLYDICLKGNGEFYWSVAVIRGQEGLWLADLSPEATPHHFASSRDDNWCSSHGRYTMPLRTGQQR